MFVCAYRDIACHFYKAIQAIRPAWFEPRHSQESMKLTDEERQKIEPSELLKLVMTRNQDDEAEQWDLIGSKSEHQTLDKQFKDENSNFKIAMVVDKWLTGFDVPCLDTMYIDKPLQKHSLIQTISRVNRNFERKNKGLVVDYIGIKKAMNLALAQYSKGESVNFEDIDFSLAQVRNYLDLLKQLFHTFDCNDYFTGIPSAQLTCLNRAAEFVLATKEREKLFMGQVKRLRAAYDLCCGSEELSQGERDQVHFYMAVRSIVFKLTKGEAPDTAQMNAAVRDMIAEALRADGVEELFKVKASTAEPIDIFDAEYLERISKIKLPNTKIRKRPQAFGPSHCGFKKA